MTRYRQTMADAYGTVVENTATALQVQNLKKAYADMKGKRISLDNAKKLQQIFNKFDSRKFEYIFMIQLNRRKKI